MRTFATLILFCAGVLRAATPEADRALLDRVQRESFTYMWERSHPVSGLACERSTGHLSPVTTGGTGFGIGAIIVAAERGWITRDQALERILKLTLFLRDKSERKSLHGAFPHWLHGETGKTMSFSKKDNGADLVETSFLMEGLLIARAYFNRPTPEETRLRDAITEIWHAIDWAFFAQGKNDALYWHWSPEYHFEMKLLITGFNECMMTYLLAAASPTHPITRKTYDAWTANSNYKEKQRHGYTIQASTASTGPLFFTHYSFIGLDPYAIADACVTRGYGVRNTTQTLINRAYCLEDAPKTHRYAPDFWGLTACAGKGWYSAHAPDNDRGVVAPTAALSSMPYTPHYSMQVLENLYRNNPQGIIGPWGPYDALSLGLEWSSQGYYLAIDQLPIVCMIENYRSGLLWRLFMSDPDVQRGLALAGLHPPAHKTGFPEAVVTLKREGGAYIPDAFDIRRHPDTGLYAVPYFVEKAQPITLTLLDPQGNRIRAYRRTAPAGRSVFTFAALSSEPDSAIYRVILKTADHTEHTLPIRMN